MPLCWDACDMLYIPKCKYIISDIYTWQFLSIKCIYYRIVLNPQKIIVIAYLSVVIKWSSHCVFTCSLQLLYWLLFCIWFNLFVSFSVWEFAFSKSASRLGICYFSAFSCTSGNFGVLFFHSYWNLLGLEYWIYLEFTNTLYFHPLFGISSVEIKNVLNI